MNHNVVKPKILVICDYYLPGYESGGSMRTLVNMVERFGDRFNFCILTRDHDGKLNTKPYETVSRDNWNHVGGSEVYYVSRDNISPSLVKRIVIETDPDAVYLNSFFSPLTIYTLILRKLGRIPKLPIILAPEGEFSAGSLSIKPLKKILYLRLANLLKLQKDIIWKVASDSEQDEVRRQTGANENIFVAANMPPRTILSEYDPAAKTTKVSGSAKMVFLSRYMRTKNLNWLLGHLGDLRGNLEIDIYGPLEDFDYWAEAKEIIEGLPKNIKVSAFGPVPNSEAASTMAKYQFFILPSLGENFGHVFIEALAAGCPLIISDRTPWRSLENKGIGWDLPLESASAWLEIIQTCLDMPAEEYDRLSVRSRQFAVDWLEDPLLDEANLRVLDHALVKSTSN